MNLRAMMKIILVLGLVIATEVNAQDNTEGMGVAVEYWAKALWERDGRWEEFEVLEKQVNKYLGACSDAKNVQACHVNWGMVGTAVMTTETRFFETPKGDQASRLVARCEAQEELCETP